MKARLHWLWLLAAFVRPASAQDPRFERLELRVAATRPQGQCVVDRGRRDRVAVDDRVVLTPRGGTTLLGRVVQVEGRTALVQLLDPKASVAPGTRGHVLVPTARTKPSEPPPAPEQTPPNERPATAADDEDAWRPGMPLLGRHRPRRPHERTTRVHGRLYTRVDTVRTLDSFSQSFVTAGADLDVDNVDGRGSRLRFSGQYFHGTEFNGVEGDDLRVFQLSYQHGGHRFDPLHWQVGRFLPRDMPEFGILDGGEISLRREGGDRFGASLGFLPELDDDMESLADLQLAAWYTWNADAGERASYTLAYQKTWHRFETDRDLIVMKTRLLPHDGWDLSSALWIDIYDAKDRLKSTSVEVTRANVFASKRDQYGGVELFYDHEQYPDMRRNEDAQRRQLLPLTLRDAHVDRVSARLFSRGERFGRFTRWTGWSDEEHVGGAVEGGFEWQDLFAERSQDTLALFYVHANTNDITGVRLQHGGDHAFGRVDVLYELGYVVFHDQPQDRNELLQHRLGALWTTDIGGGWDASFSADATLWDDELSFAASIYLQHVF